MCYMIYRYEDVLHDSSIQGYSLLKNLCIDTRILGAKKNTTTNRKSYLECTHTHIRDYYINSHIYTHRLWTIQGA